MFNPIPARDLDFNHNDNFFGISASWNSGWNKYRINKISEWMDMDARNGYMSSLRYYRMRRAGYVICDFGKIQKSMEEAGFIPSSVFKPVKKEFTGLPLLFFRRKDV